MNSEKLFQIVSYAAVFCGFFALWISGVFGLVGTGLFLAAMIGAWFLEETKWQVSERLGTALIVLSLPVYFAAYKAGFFPAIGSDFELPGILARLIVSLTAIKLLQRKSDRDWIFLYVMSFFEVLLAAGLSISALYLASFLAYVFLMVCTTILFEMRRTRDDHLRQRLGNSLTRSTSADVAPLTGSLLPTSRIPVTAVVLIVLIIAIAGPMFFLLPRVGGAGFGGGSREDGGVKTASGFSDTVRLGGFGRIREDDEVIMRVRIDEGSAADLERVRWRGIALDTFDNQSWSKSKPGHPNRFVKGASDLIQVANARGRDRLVLQTVYLEPIDSPVIFVLPRAVGIHAGTQPVSGDENDSLKIDRKGGRISYRVVSDASVPEIASLRKDRKPYSAAHSQYLQLPTDLDPRIARLSKELIANPEDRYSAARAVEEYLQTQFGYTLDLKAGGEQPLADFLLNVREGHCEYFATAMAVMLRTQGIATRVVNGFQQGEYNETAGVFVVRQRNAHSWVEVYFPTEEAWVTFDPTPFAGQTSSTGSVGILNQFNKYVEALETFWIQYFVAYDGAEQRSLITSIRRGVINYGASTTSFFDGAQNRILAWWLEVRGDKGVRNSAIAVAYGLAYLAAAALGIVVLGWLYRWIARSSLWHRLRNWMFNDGDRSIVEFYERMQGILAGKGLSRPPHQTPLEFAHTAGIPEVVNITEKYNRVRFGEKGLSSNEVRDIEDWLKKISA